RLQYREPRKPLHPEATLVGGAGGPDEYCGTSCRGHRPLLHDPRFFVVPLFADKIYTNASARSPSYTGCPATHVALTARSSPSVINTNSRSIRVSAWPLRNCISGVAVGSSTTRSASLPGAIEPMRSSRYNASAPPRVASHKPCAAVRLAPPF